MNKSFSYITLFMSTLILSSNFSGLSLAESFESRLKKCDIKCDSKKFTDAQCLFNKVICQKEASRKNLDASQDALNNARIYKAPQKKHITEEDKALSITRQKNRAIEQADRNIDRDINRDLRERGIIINGGQ